MKTYLSNTKRFILTSILLCLTSFVFANINQADWYGNQHFDFTLNEEHLSVQINKNPWESFTLTIDHQQIIENPVVQLEVSSDQDIVLRVDISDGVFMSSRMVVIEKQVKGTSMFYQVDYDFRDVLSEIDLSDDAYLIFYVNPGKKFNGVIDVKQVKFSANPEDETMGTATMDESFNVYPSPASNFTNVSIPAEGCHTLRLLDTSGKEIFTEQVSRFAGQTYTIDLMHVQKGYYLVQLLGNDRVMTEKLIVN